MVPDFYVKGILVFLFLFFFLFLTCIRALQLKLWVCWSKLILYLHGVWWHWRLDMGIFDELPLPSDKDVSFTLLLLRFLFMIRLVVVLTEGFPSSGSILRSFGRSCVCCS